MRTVLPETTGTRLGVGGLGRQCQDDYLIKPYEVRDMLAPTCA